MNLVPWGSFSLHSVGIVALNIENCLEDDVKQGNAFESTRAWKVIGSLIISHLLVGMPKYLAYAYLTFPTKTYIMFLIPEEYDQLP